MTLDRPLSEWQADLSVLRNLWFERYKRMKSAAIALPFNKTRKEKRKTRSCIRLWYREWDTLGRQIYLCESAISFHEAMLNHRP